MPKPSAPKFYAALAHTDNMACFKEGDEGSERQSNIRFLPERIRDNLLFSLSFDSSIHYECSERCGDHRCSDILAGDLPWTKPRRVFADCGAFQFRDMSTPQLGDGTLLDHSSAWEMYKKAHLGDRTDNWEEILLCSPDHIVTEDMTDEEAKTRLEYTISNAPGFLDAASEVDRVTPVAVIHGRTVAERKEQYDEFVSMGFDYVALGGMVPFSGKTGKVLDIVCDTEDQDDPSVGGDSILSRCRRDGVRLHMFGLNSPDWCRWWYRLGMDSFDGSKLSTEGAANGWYWLPKDGKYGREAPEKPVRVSDLYHKLAVKKMGAEEWVWRIDEGVLVPANEVMVGELNTRCDCPACRYLGRARCTSPRCWKRKSDLENGVESRHCADPRMMGSTEHNMGRVAHNAHVMDWLLSKIEELMDRASESDLQGDESWLRNWSRIR